jgi:hypothetical protein
MVTKMKCYLNAALLTIAICGLLICSCPSLDASSNAPFAAAANVTLDSGFTIYKTNSTVSQLILNEAAKEVTFTVTGPEGSAGYVWCTIAENMIPDHNDFSKKVKVFLDGNEVNYTYSFDEGAWQLFLDYTNGTHEVKISLPEEAGFLGVSFWVWAVILILVCTSFAVAVLFLHRKRVNQNVLKS